MSYREIKSFFYQYDLDSTSFKYGRLGDASGHWVQGKLGVETVGSTTTIDRSPSAGDPFAPVTAGDFIRFKQPPDTISVRKVATKVSTAQITVNTAIDLGTDGVCWDFWPFRVGTTASDGWHHVHGDQMSVFVEVTTLAAAGGVEVQVEGRVGGSPHVLSAQTYTTTGTYEIPVTSPVSMLRVGLRAVTDASGTDSISVRLVQRQFARSA